MKKSAFGLILYLSLICWAVNATAATEEWEIDKAHSGVYFDIRHTYATVRGQFEEYSGTVRFDPENLQVSSVEFEVETESVNTGNPNRDNHLRSDEFFAVKQYPAMTFKSTAVEPVEGNRYTLEGILTIRDVSMKIAVPMTYIGTGENPLKKGQQVAGFEARFSIDRLDFNVGTGKYLKMGVIGKQVDILIALEVLKNG
jgi:polyisoprenoid-binding protein YceI